MKVLIHSTAIVLLSASAVMAQPVSERNEFGFDVQVANFDSLRTVFSNPVDRVLDWSSEQSSGYWNSGWTDANWTRDGDDEDYENYETHNNYGSHDDNDRWSDRFDARDGYEDGDDFDHDVGWSSASNNDRDRSDDGGWHSSDGGGWNDSDDDGWDGGDSDSDSGGWGGDNDSDDD